MQHLGSVLLVPGPGACLARPGLPCSRGKPRQPSPSLLPLLVSLAVSSFVLRASSPLGCTATVVETCTPCGHIPLHTQEHGLPWHAGTHGPHPTPAAPCKSWLPHKPCLSTRCLLKKKGQAPLGRPALPRHKGTASAPTPRAGSAWASFCGGRTGEWPQSLEAKVRDPRIQPPPTDGTRHPPHWPPGTFPDILVLKNS